MALKWRRPQFMAISDKNNDKKGQAYVVQGHGVIIGPKKRAAAYCTPLTILDQVKIHLRLKVACII